MFLKVIKYINTWQVNGGKEEREDINMQLIWKETNTTKSYKLTIWRRIVIWRLTKIDGILEKCEITKLEEQIATIV